MLEGLIGVFMDVLLISTLTQRLFKKEGSLEGNLLAIKIEDSREHAARPPILDHTGKKSEE